MVRARKSSGRLGQTARSAIIQSLRIAARKERANITAARKERANFAKEIGMRGMHKTLVNTVFQLSRNDLGIRAHGLGWVCKIRDTGGVKIKPFLIKLLEKETKPEKRASLLGALAQLGEKQHLPELIELIKKLDNPLERKYAILYLPLSADLKVIKFLEEMKNDQKMEVRDAAQKVLAAISRGN